MREYPVLFNGAMVRAILSGAKTQTRRVIKDQPFDRSWSRHDHRIHYMAGCASNGDELDGLWAYSASSGGEWMAKCPFGQPGDRLWVRESFRIGEDLGEDWEHGMDIGDRFPIYQADGEHGRYGVVPPEWDPPRNAREVHNSKGTAEHWRSFGPIPSTNMPRWACRIVLEITAVRVERLQAISEADALAEGIKAAYGRFTHNDGLQECCTAAGAFEALWTSTGGDWASNPCVWVIEFKRVEVG